MSHNMQGVEKVREYFFSRPSTLKFTSLSEDVDELFKSTSTGFRELLATIIYAKHLDPSYSPRADFYVSRPRSLYEKGIKPVFDERGIPCGQSGPLNVAKATPALNEQWASQRRPKSTATALLRIVDWLLEQPQSTLIEFSLHLGSRFDELADLASSSRIRLPKQDSSTTIAFALYELMEKFPLSGAVPQTVCGLLLEAEILDHPSMTVQGTRGSVFASNKTSKKLGDLTLHHLKAVERVYEITVKPFGEQRVREAAQSIKAYFGGEPPEGFSVKVLCMSGHTPPDIKNFESNYFFGELYFGGVTFEFIDIREWVAGRVAEFSVVQRSYFVRELTDFLNGVRIPEAARKTWQSSMSPDRGP